MARRRFTPYTAEGIKRVSCLRCGKPATHQWQICADRNAFRPICVPCDVALNRMVLEFMKFPPVEVSELMHAYRMKQEAGF